MALPHYNLDTSNDIQQFQLSSFPVVLVPAEAPRKTLRVRQFLRARLWLTTWGIIAVLAITATLWIALDPNHKAFDLKQLFWPAVTLGSCGFFFLLALLAGGEGKAAVEEDEVEEVAESEILLPEPRNSRTLVPTAPHIEFRCEEWVSEPFSEIIDEALLAEVFDDEMVAPDHMVFSLRVDD